MIETETFEQRDVRLRDDNPRSGAVALALAQIEEPRVGIEPALEALRLLLDDSIADADDYSLTALADGLHRAYVVWAGAGANDAAVVENRGEIRGLANVASMRLERMIPMSVLAELERDSLPHRMLRVIAEEEGIANDALCDTLGADKTQVSRAGTRLRAAGVAVSRRVGRRNMWEVTPRGLQTLAALNAGGRTRPIRRRRAAA